MTERILLDTDFVANALPVRDPFSHKGTFGRVLLITGSKNMVGCCTLAAKGALRSGAGIVTLAFPDVLYDSLTAQLTENLFLPLETDSYGFISHNAIGTILDEANKADVIMVGCGIGMGYAQSLIVTSLISMEGKRIILDADALNNLAECTDILKKAKADILITPHPGELARLFNCTVADIESDREKAATDFALKYKVNVLLKGHETVIVNNNATEIYINKTGNTGLSKGGSGDLLSGIIAGLMPSFSNVCLCGAVGAYIHGMCADVLKEEFTEYAMLPSDCADVLPKVFKELLSRL